MKRFLITSLFLLSTACDAFAVNELWSAATQSNLDDARKASDPKYLQFKAKVDAHACSYDDYGLQHAIMYKATGDASYCAAAYANNGGCVAGANRNKTRDCFVDRALTYSICGNAVTPGERAEWESQLDAILTQVQSDSHGTRTWDTDELNGHYFGGTIYCLAKYGNLSECKTGGHGAVWGGVDSTGDNTNTLRNAIYHYYSSLSGGTFVEGSEYNQGTLYYAMQGVNAINAFYGRDKFPEITDLFERFADFHVQYHVPGYSENFAFGDIQKIGYRYDYRVRVLYAAFAHLDNDDPVMWHLWNATYSDECVRMGWGMFYDHNAQTQAPNGQTDFFAAGTGIQLWHEGWVDSNESFYASMMKSRSNADHDANGWTNFNLWRSGGWAIQNGKGYYGTLYAEANYLNTMMVNGGLPYVWQEARGTHLHEEGPNYAYQVGLTGGNSMYSSYWDPPPESLHEWTRSHFYYKHKDDSDTIIVFDRVNAENPQKLANYSRHTNEMKGFIDRAGGKHRVLFQAAADPTQIGNRITWFADSSETVYLDTFIPKFSYREEFLNGSACAGCGGNMGTDNPTLDYRIILQSEETAQHQSFANILHAGSTPVTKEIISHSGETAKGYRVKSGTENLVVIFNGTDRTADLPEPTTKPGEKEIKDPGKFDDLKVLHFFKEGFSVSVNTEGDAHLFIMDLHPDILWKAGINGGAAQAIIPSEAGIYQTRLKGSGAHIIAVNAAGVLISSDPADASGFSGVSVSPDNTNSRGVLVSSDSSGSSSVLVSAGASDSRDVFVSSDARAATCSNDWNLCTTSADCSGTGWFWDGSRCLGKPAASTCDDDCALCGTEPLCESSASKCHWWSDGLCKDTADLCAEDSANCDTEADCASKGYLWCEGACRESQRKEISRKDSCSCKRNDTHSLSCSCTVTECADQIMIIAVGREERGDTSPNSLTWNGVSALHNFIGSDTFWYETAETEIYYLLDPDPGDHRLAVTYRKGASVDINLGMSTFCGVAQRPQQSRATGEENVTVITHSDNALIVTAITSIEQTDFRPEGRLIKDWEIDNLGLTLALGYYQADEAGPQACHWNDSQEHGDRSGNVCAAFKAVDHCTSVPKR